MKIYNTAYNQWMKKFDKRELIDISEEILFNVFAIYVYVVRIFNLCTNNGSCNDVYKACRFLKVLCNYERLSNVTECLAQFKPLRHISRYIFKRRYCRRKRKAKISELLKNIASIKRIIYLRTYVCMYLCVYASIYVCIWSSGRMWK